jgi:hypothetical protein
MTSRHSQYSLCSRSVIDTDDTAQYQRSLHTGRTGVGWAAISLRRFSRVALACSAQFACYKSCGGHDTCAGRLHTRACSGPPGSGARAAGARANGSLFKAHIK